MLDEIYIEKINPRVHKATYMDIMGHKKVNAKGIGLQTQINNEMK